jgi:hypothetical protein
MYFDHNNYIIIYIDMYVFLDVCQLMLGGLRHTGLKYASKNIGQRGGG